MTDPNRLIFRKRLRRRDSIATVLRWPYDQSMHALAKRHLADKRRQLVVFSFDYIAHGINTHGVYEVDELDTFFQWIRRYGEATFRGSAVDIGANIGNHSVYFSDYFEQVYSFEPNPRTFAVLALNAELATNVKCFNVGISNAAGTAALDSSAGNVGGARIVEAATGTSRPIKLQTLDAVLGDAHNVKLIKVDVEGHEYQALLGAERIIRGNRPLVLFEQHRHDFVGGQSRVVELLRSFGYARFATLRRQPRLPARVNATARHIYAAIARIVLGESIDVVVQQNFEHDQYSFIVAVPDWIDLSKDEGDAARATR
jgi:FkbM family methyltransferase